MASAKAHQVRRFLKLVENHNLQMEDEEESEYEQREPLSLSHQPFFDAENGDYIADMPDFKVVSAFGERAEEALREVLIALEMSSKFAEGRANHYWKQSIARHISTE